VRLLHTDLYVLLREAPDYGCDRKSRAAYAQSFALWQQATIEFTYHDHSIISCSRHIYNDVILYTHPDRGESHNQRNATREVPTLHWCTLNQTRAQLLVYSVCV